MPHEADKNSKPMPPKALPPRPMRLPGITPPNAPRAVRNADTIPGNQTRTDTVTDPQIVCPECHTEIKLTESLAAPLIDETRRQFEAQLSAKEADFGRREAKLKEIQEDVAKAREAIDEQVATRLKAARAAIVAAEANKAEDTLKSKVAEKEAQIAGMQRQIEDLRRKAEQGSQQLQGETLEIELESLLGSRFPRDVIEPVAKGEFGGDVVHRVLGPMGQDCGTILWESKHTKNWSDGWLAKLRDDQRAAKAEIALIVSRALPKGVESFDLIDNIWVAEPSFAIPLAVALRQSLIDLAGSRQAQQGQQTKMELMYAYLTGPRFRHRIDAIVEKFTDMHADLDRERKMMTRLWAKREEQLRGGLESTAGLYGDLQGIAGRAMQEIESLDEPIGAYPLATDAKRQLIEPETAPGVVFCE